jgi:hypothetical protein
MNGYLFSPPTRQSNMRFARENNAEPMSTSVYTLTREFSSLELIFPPACGKNPAMSLGFQLIVSEPVVLASGLLALLAAPAGAIAHLFLENTRVARQAEAFRQHNQTTQIPLTTHRITQTK